MTLYLDGAAYGLMQLQVDFIPASNDFVILFSSGETELLSTKRKTMTTNREVADNRTHGRSPDVLDISVEIVNCKASIIGVPNMEEQ
jgi:hypothetical protein